MSVPFAEYNAETERLIAFVLARLDEDDVLAGAMRTPRLIRFVTLVGPLRENVADYRDAVQRYTETTGVERRFWQRAARFHAFGLRLGAGQYSDRAGFDPAWRRAPRPPS
ncbi:MAG: hypothetical protein L0H64_17065 [Pseudonocardia sp.]|nr:hypothetical protein [Pseudonocardia sp.]